MNQIDEELLRLEAEVKDAKKRLKEARAQAPKERVGEYVFHDREGREIQLSGLVGEKNDLILVHNMGAVCIYCTLWADGFTGLMPHLSDRAAFVVSTPDSWEKMSSFADGRGWNFPMVSVEGTSFIDDMGFRSKSENYKGPLPGVSTFRKEADGTIFRVNKASFYPGDDFCVIWPFFDLLEGGAGEWQPEYDYTNPDRDL